MCYLSNTALAGLAVAGLTIAAPTVKRSYTINDGIILNYALTLEYLERAFYREGTSKYDDATFVSAGFPQPFHDNLLEIYSDEQTHVSFLSEALTNANITPTVELQYSFPYTDPRSFVTLASVLEGVGVSAYLGAAASIANPAYLTAAASILTVESRHSSYIRASIDESPFPSAFDTPLDFNQVYTLAASFITGGSSPVTLPFKPFPTLTLQSSQYYYEANRSSATFHGAFANAQKFSNGTITASTPIYAIFYSGLQKLPVQAHVTQGSMDYKVDTLPAGIAGQVYVMLSTSNTAFTDETFIAGPAILEVYPKGKIPSTPDTECS